MPTMLGQTLGNLFTGANPASIWECRVGEHAYHSREIGPVGTAAEDAEEDLARARAELLPLFQIVRGDKGNASPNAISQEELERLAQLYSAIRRGESRIQLDANGLDGPAAASFREGAMSDIAALMQSAVGRRTLLALSSPGAPIGLSQDPKATWSEPSRSTATSAPEGPTRIQYAPGGINDHWSNDLYPLTERLSDFMLLHHLSGQVAADRSMSRTESDRLREEDYRAYKRERARLVVEQNRGAVCQSRPGHTAASELYEGLY